MVKYSLKTPIYGEEIRSYFEDLIYAIQRSTKEKKCKEPLFVMPQLELNGELYFNCDELLYKTPTNRVTSIGNDIIWFLKKYLNTTKKTDIIKRLDFKMEFTLHRIPRNSSEYKFVTMKFTTTIGKALVFADILRGYAVTDLKRIYGNAIIPYLDEVIGQPYNPFIVQCRTFLTKKLNARYEACRKEHHAITSIYEAEKNTLCVLHRGDPKLDKMLTALRKKMMDDVEEVTSAFRREQEEIEDQIKNLK